MCRSIGRLIARFRARRALEHTAAPSDPIQSDESPGLLADAPLKHPSLDRLARADFARQIARAITGLAGDDSFVLAICGPWGSGKSTIANFAIHELESLKDRSSAPLVVRFNPWWFSGQNQLMLSFLDQLGGALGRPDISRALEHFSRALSLSSAVLRLLPWVPGASQAAQATQHGCPIHAERGWGTDHGRRRLKA